MTEKNQYKIAVLLPTRGRTDALFRSVVSLLNRGVNLDSVCIMFAFDNDDNIGKTHFQEHVQPWLDNKGVDYTAMEFEPLGYGRLNDYLNALAKEVVADWYFFWNDDAIMETSGWDREIIKHTDKFKLLAVHTHRDHPYSIFPIVPRAWFDTIGYLSPHSMTDAWLSQIAYQLDIWERIEVYVTHDRADLTGNNKDDTYQQRELLEGNPNNPRDFHHPSYIQLRSKETELLSLYMEKQGLDITWWKNIKAGTQDPWQRLKENDVNSQMSHFKINFKK
jgi:hypothetical protein